VIIEFCLVFPKIFLLHEVVRDAKKVEKHCSRQLKQNWFKLEIWPCLEAFDIIKLACGTSYTAILLLSLLYPVAVSEISDWLI